jgi:hypothetical protein
MLPFLITPFPFCMADKAGGLDTDDGDVMMLVPPLFAIKDNPTNIA